jgi:hypothetical protein
MIRDARIWRDDSWWRPNGDQWVAVETRSPAEAQWTRVARDVAPLVAAVADEALALSHGQPIATFAGDAIVLVTREWGARCVRQLVSSSAATLSTLPPPPLAVVLRPHPFGAAGIDDSIKMVREAIERGRNNRFVIAWARRRIHVAGLNGPRSQPSPDQIAAILFAAQKREVSFVRDPVNGEAMADAEHLLCLDPLGPCIPAGDCDEQLIIAGAALLAVGIPVRLVVRKYAGIRQGHITLEYDSNPRLGGPWRCLDPSTDSGTCSQAPYTEQIVVDLVAPEDQTFVGLGSPIDTGTIGQPPSQLPDDQAAGWLGQLQGVQSFLSSAQARLRKNAAAFASVRADLGLPPYDGAGAAGGEAGSPLAAYVQSGQWTEAAQAAETKLLQTAQFISQCLDDGLTGRRPLSYQTLANGAGDILIGSQGGDPYSILLAPGPLGTLVPTYFDAQGNTTGTLGLAPILIGGIVAAVSLAVAYVVAKICDQLATAHHDDALNKIATEQSQLIAAGKQTPEQAQAMVRALADLNKTQAPKPSGWEEFLQSFPAAAIVGAALAGAVGGFALSRLLSGAFRLPVSATPA